MSDLSAVIREAGSCLVEHLPLLDRIKFRCLSKALLQTVDASLTEVRSLCINRDLPLRDSDHQLEALLWLSGKCRNMEILSVSGTPDVELRLRYGCRIWEHSDVINPAGEPRLGTLLAIAVGSVGRLVKYIALPLLRYTKRMHQLDLSQAPELTDQHVTAIARGCPKLLILDVSHSPFVTDAGIAAVGERCRQLQLLNISHCGHVGDAGLAVVTDRCRDLRQLFAARTRISNAFYSTLAKSGVTLSALSTARAWTPRLQTLAPLLSRWQALEHLDVGMCTCLQGPFVHINHVNRVITLEPLNLDVIGDNCPNLRYLDISGLYIRGELVMLAPKCRELRTVILEHAGASNNDVIALAAHCRHLHTLDVNYCRYINDAAIQELAHRCPLLERLSVAGCSGVKDSSLMAITAHCKNFQEINWENSGITNDGIQKAFKGRVDAFPI